MAQFKHDFWGSKGFADLRKYVKESSDFTKCVYAILNERANLENQYAKGLEKLANKLHKAAEKALGTTKEVWQKASDVMKEEGKHHKDLATSLKEDVVPEMKSLCDSYSKKIKTVEGPVDKMWKHFQDACNEEQKLKKHSFSSNREYEHLEEQVSDSRQSKAKGLTLKDIAKLETKRKKWQETSLRAESDYFGACVKRERLRQHWEMRVTSASVQFQELEKHRLEQMQDLAQTYTNFLTLVGPKVIESCESLSEAVGHLDPEVDLQAVSVDRGRGPAVMEQVLPDFFGEDQNNSIRKERRREALQRHLQTIQHDLDGERKSYADVRAKLTDVSNTHNANQNNMVQTVENTLRQVQSMVFYLEACLFKVQCALADLENCNRPTNQLAPYLVQQRNKQGIQSILKIPTWLSVEQLPNGNCTNGQQQRIHQQRPETLPAVGRCQALYAYEATAADELTLSPGDIISIQRKTSDWWQGELNGHVGLFPASYVEELPLES